MANLQPSTAPGLASLPHMTLSTQTYDLNALLDETLAGQDLSPEATVWLFQQTHPEQIERIRQAADSLRDQLVGPTVTYVVNRNINFTNICEQHCSFCAFRRDPDTEGAYWLDTQLIKTKVSEAVSCGATEICMQGGLNPEARTRGSTLNYYLDLVETIKSEHPTLHLHAFSPQEVQFIARQDQLSIQPVLQQLQQAGVDSMPGTAAEVLVPQIRQKLCPEKISTAEWVDIVSTAHQLGLPTTSTMLSGHIETLADRVQHLSVIRAIQQRSSQLGSRGFTEFILLPYVGETAPAKLRRQVGHDQPNHQDALFTMAIARLFLGSWIRNHQPSWVKLGLTTATLALKWGCNDLGGTLMEEHITTMAGAQGGTGKTIQELRAAIETLNRPAQQRTTLYQHYPLSAGLMI